MFQFWLFFSRCYPENIEGNKLNSIYINVDFFKGFSCLPHFDSNFLTIFFEKNCDILSGKYLFKFIS